MIGSRREQHTARAAAGAFLSLAGAKVRDTSGGQQPPPRLLRREASIERMANFASAACVNAKRRRVEVTVTWNDDRHTLSIPLRRWREIEAKKPVRIRGKGYRYGAEFFWDYWTFNEPEPDALRVEYGKDRRDRGTGFEGLISDAEVTFPRSDDILEAGTLAEDSKTADIPASGVEIDWAASTDAYTSLSSLLEKAVDTGIWVREEDLPDVTPELLLEEGYIEDEARIAELKKGAKPTAEETGAYINRFVENALNGNADSDFIPGYAIAPIKGSGEGSELYALLISFGYSFTEVRTELVRIFGSVEEAKAFMRSGGYI